MAKPLDKDTYKLVEWHLHREMLMRDIVRDYETEVLHASRGTDYSEPNICRSGTPGDPVSRKAFALEEGTPEVRRARRWLRVIERTKEWFTDTTEGKLFELFYGKTAPIDLVAAAMGVTTRRIDQLRDNIVFRGAMYALEERLFRLEDGDERKEQGHDSHERQRRQ